MKKASASRTVAPDRIFCGVYPCGLVFADRHRESAGDYKRLAFLPYNTLKIEFEKDTPAHLRAAIEKDVAEMALKPGATFRISSSGQTVVLGTAVKELEVVPGVSDAGAASVRA